MSANRFAPFAALAMALVAPFAEGAVKAVKERLAAPDAYPGFVSAPA